MVGQSEVRGIPESGELSFTALRNGTKLGAHAVSFAWLNDVLTVDITVDYMVKLGFITVFRYSLRGREQWQGGVLQSARADTKNNGKSYFMQAKREGEALMVEGTFTPQYRAPAGALIASLWNQAQLGAPMVSPQDGELLQFDVASRGPAKVADSAGHLRPGERFALAGKYPVDLWYDTQGVWIALQATIRDGSVVTYLLNS